jgi:hypothetical protein
LTEDMDAAVDAASKACEILLQKDVHGGTFLVVEGEHDEEFYSNIVSEKDCRIVYCLGKNMVKEVVANLLNGFVRVPQVIGIIDADYDRVRWRTPRQYENIFRTDTHDLETMIIRSSAFTKIVNTYVDKNRIQELLRRRGLNLKDLLLTEGTTIGCLFIIDLPKEDRLDLGDLEFENFLNASNLEVDLIKLVDYVIKRTPGCRVDRMTLVSQLKKLIAEEIDPWQICNGHHLTRILTIGINEVFGKRTGSKVSASRIEIELKLAYEKAHFKSTDLCRQIREWENNNAPFRVLDDSLRG